ncbi:MAG: hypothetical protein ACK5X9_12150 [Alphaproteobacteria bacterium]
MQFFIKNRGDFGREAGAFHQQPFVEGFRDAVQIFQQFTFTKRRQIGPEQIGRMRAGQNGRAIHPADPLVQPDHFGIGFQHLIRQGAESQQQFPQGLPQAGAGLLVRYPIPEQGGQFGPWHPLARMQAKIAQNGAGLAAAGHQILPQIADGAKRAEQVDANNRLPGADIQRHTVVLIGILLRQCHPLRRSIKDTLRVRL